MDADLSRDNRRAVVEAIKKAFAKVSREGGVSLHEARAIDDYCTKEECAAARELDTEKSWEELPSEWIEQYDSVLGYMDPIGFRYYLPAYMAWTLENHTSDSASNDEAVCATRRRDRAKFQLFTAEQNTAVALFLRYLRDHGDEMESKVTGRVLKQYWAQFLPAEEP